VQISNELDFMEQEKSQGEASDIQLDTTCSPTEAVDITDTTISAKERKAAREAEKKRVDYFNILKRTLIAIIAGIAAGAICFYFEAAFIGTQGSSDFSLLSILIMIACILVQKHVFMALGIDYTLLEKKDWFYQGFMTFGFWLITWTILLSGTFDEAAISTVVANVTNNV
jgi:hypothetical protein